MQERLKNILNRVKEFWDRFNKKQKTLFIAISAGIVITIVILAFVFAQPNRVTLRNCTTAEEAVEVRTLLTDNGIKGYVDDNYTVTVDKANYTEAKLVLGSNNISSDGYSLNDAVSSSFTTTETEKEAKYKAYLESKFAKDLEQINGIKHANVNIMYTNTDSTIYAENKDTSITAVLTLSKTLSDEQAEAIGMLLSTNVGNNNTNSVLVIDNNSNVLYTGGTNNVSSSASASKKVSSQLSNAIIKQVSAAFIKTGIYNDIDVVPNLVVDFDDVQVVKHEYKAPDGTDAGLPSKSYVVNSEGAIADASGNAGTDSNTSGTSYQVTNSDGSKSTYSLQDYGWLQNETITTTTAAKGSIKYADSSIAIVAMQNTVLTQQDATDQGLLKGTTWAAFKASHTVPTVTTVDQTFYDIVSKGTGIATNKITIVGYQKYTFYEDTTTGFPWMFAVQIALAVLIAGVLVFIIIRSTRPVAVGETEPELSVEDMLATTKQKLSPVEEIDLQDKSETRKAIEKFVDENPEAVALLLRNWLDEDW